MTTQTRKLIEVLDSALTWWHSVPSNFEKQEPAWLEEARAVLKTIKTG